MNRIYECLDKSCIYRTAEGFCMKEEVSLDQEHHCMDCIFVDGESNDKKS